MCWLWEVGLGWCVSCVVEVVVGVCWFGRRTIGQWAPYGRRVGWSWLLVAV